MSFLTVLALIAGLWVCASLVATVLLYALCRSAAWGDRNLPVYDRERNIA